MNNAEFIKGLDLVIEGLTTIKNAVSTDAVAPEVETPKKSKSESRREKAQKEEPMNPPVEETEGSAKEVAGQYTLEELRGMKYNEFKKLASSLGVKCTGTRDEIEERIIALGVVVEDATEEQPIEEQEEAPVKSSKPARSKKLGKKEADEPVRDEFDEQAEEIAKETPVADIIKALADVEVKATKKNAVEKLAYALREGLIALDDEEEVVEEAGDEDEITADSYFPEFDPNGYNNPEKMTEERAEAVVDKMDEILTAYSEGELTDEDIEAYIEDNATEVEVELLGEEYTEEDLLKMYMELVKRTIDNDGEEYEQGDAYEVNDKNFCCGHELKYVKKTKKFICEHCGEEYEAE